MRISDWSSDVCSSDLRSRVAASVRATSPGRVSLRVRQIAQITTTAIRIGPNTVNILHSPPMASSVPIASTGEANKRLPLGQRKKKAAPKGGAEVLGRDA